MMGSLMHVLQVVVVASTLIISCSAESSAAVVAPPKGNIAKQLAGGIKDWVVSYGDAFKLMRMDHEQCNMIRQKQNRFKASLKNDWEELGVDQKEIRTRLSKVSGGISFDEFLFLRNGKRDREKLISLVFYASFLPKMMPYMLMFNSGNMLPEQFPKKQTLIGETKREKQSRDRSHAVLKMLMSLERNAHVQGFSINPFGGAKKKKQMAQYDAINMSIEEALSTGSSPGPDYVMKQLDDQIFLSEKPKAKELGLVGIPKVFTRGLANLVSGNPNRALEGLIPNFIDRTAVLSHLKSVSVCDEFLVNQEVDVNSLTGATLVEACGDRMIATLGSSETDMRNKLGAWLRYAAIIPARRTQTTGEHHNANLARSALMCYYAMDALRQKQSAAPLPRLLMKLD